MKNFECNITNVEVEYAFKMLLIKKAYLPVMEKNKELMCPPFTLDILQFT